jgi:hypothetical protein
MNTIHSLIDDFTGRLNAMLERQIQDRARVAVESAFAGHQRGPGRPAAIASLAAVRPARRKGPKQLCPVPGCKDPAAPVFGMVCSKHKDLPKTKIKKYREERRAKKLKAA